MFCTWGIFHHIDTSRVPKPDKPLAYSQDNSRKCEVPDIDERMGNLSLASNAASHSSQALESPLKISGASNIGGSGRTSISSGTRLTPNRVPMPVAAVGLGGIRKATRKTTSKLKTTGKTATEFRCHEPNCKKKGNRFRDRSKLRNHQLTHSTAQPWRCQKCPTRFKQKKDLNRHVRERCKGREYAKEDQSFLPTQAGDSTDDGKTPQNTQNPLDTLNYSFFPDRTSPHISSYPQSPPYPETFNYLDPQSWHTPLPQGGFHAPGNSNANEVIPPQSHDSTETGDSVRLAQGGDLVSVLQPTADTHIWARAQLRETPNRLLRIERVLKSLQQWDLEAHLEGRSEPISGGLSGGENQYEDQYPMSGPNEAPQGSFPWVESEDSLSYWLLSAGSSGLQQGIYPGTEGESSLSYLLHFEGQSEVQVDLSVDRDRSQGECYSAEFEVDFGWNVPY